jgi:hypothetical protein
MTQNVVQTNSTFLYHGIENLLLKLVAEKPDKISKILDDEYRSITAQLGNNRVLIISHVWESVDPDSWKKILDPFIARLKEQVPGLTVIQIADSWYKNQNTKLAATDAIYYFDFFLLRVFYKILIEKKSTPATLWNSNSKKLLFLTGKPNKTNRVRLLYKLVTEGLIDQTTWSFSCRNLDEINQSNVFINEMTPDEFSEFVKKYTNFPDKYYSPTGVSYDSYESSVFENKLFNLISETDFDRGCSPPWITEKTWLTIANRLPFIVAGEHKTLQQLQAMGFKTFEDYLLIPNYDNPYNANYLHYKLQGFFQNRKSKQHWHEFYQGFKGPDWPDSLEFSQINTLPQNWQDEIVQSYFPTIQADSDLRLDAIVQNVEFWLDNITQYKTQICTDIETNYNRFIELGADNLQTVHNIKKLHGLEGDLLENMFSG